MLDSLAVASLVFLVLYSILFAALLIGVFTRQINLKGRYLVVLIHVMLRLAAQCVGLAFGIIGYDATGLLVAYLVLAAEGYFSLVLCAARFLISYHNHVFGDSWLEPRAPKRGANGQRMNIRSRLLRSGGFVVDQSDSEGRQVLDPVTGKPRRKVNVMGMVHQLLIAANVMIVVGGTQLNGTAEKLKKENPADPASGWDQDSTVITSKALRGAGQAIFLVFCLCLIGCMIWTMRQTNQLCIQRSSGADPVKPSRSQRSWYGHPLLLVLLATTPFLVVRGVFGVCQAIIDSLNYYYPPIYTADGLATEFVAKESVLATAMEWSACALLICSWPILKTYGYGDEAAAEQKDIETPLNKVRALDSNEPSSDKPALPLYR